MEDRLVIGFIEEVKLENGKTYLAKIDTGADSSSIDELLIEEIGEKEIVSHKIIRSALGRVRRPTMMINIEMKGIKFYEKFSISDRRNLKYKILIGKDILRKEGFLIDSIL